MVKSRPAAPRRSGSRSPARGSDVHLEAVVCCRPARPARPGRRRPRPRARRGLARRSASRSANRRSTVRADSLRGRRRRVAERAQHPRRRRHDHRPRPGQPAQRVGVQRARAAERDEREVARVEALLHGHEAQAAEHVLVDDVDDARRRGLHGLQAHRVGDGRDGGPGGVDVERDLAARQRRREVAEHHVGVGDGRVGAALAVRGRDRDRRRRTAGRRAAPWSARGTCAIEPPPAPTVRTSTVDARTVRSPTVVSRPIRGARSWTSATSVDVPPMSNVMRSRVAALLGHPDRAGHAARRAGQQHGDRRSDCGLGRRKAAVGAQDGQLARHPALARACPPVSRRSA